MESDLNKKPYVKKYIKNEEGVLVCSKCGTHGPGRRCDILSCDRCGKNYHPFFANSKSGISNKNFCTHRCYIDYVKNIENLTPPQESQKIDYVCKYCNTSFKAHRYRKKVQYCSIKCSNDDFRRNIKCKTCGASFKRANHRGDVYCGQECANKGVDKRNSKFSNNVYLFLSSHFNNIEKEKYINDDNKRYSVDFVIGKYAIECYGDYWHCNPKRYKEDYYNSRIKKTAKEVWDFDSRREEYLKSKGYHVIIIWEIAWLKDLEYRNLKIKEILNEVCEN